MAHFDAATLQYLWSADTRELKQLGRGDRPGAEDDLARRSCTHSLAIAGVDNPRAASAIESQPAGRSLSDDVQIRAFHRRSQIALGGAHAPTAPNRRLRHAHAFLDRPVVIRIAPNTVLACR